MAANGQPAFQGANEGPGANQIVNTAPVAARGLALVLATQRRGLLFLARQERRRLRSGAALQRRMPTPPIWPVKSRSQRRHRHLCPHVCSSISVVQPLHLQTESGGITASEITYSYSLTSLNIFATTLASTDRLLLLEVDAEMPMKSQAQRGQCTRRPKRRVVLVACPSGR